jgi:uncharacterized membrane protein (DUF485 family)
MEKEPSAFGALGRRLVAWIVLIAIAVIALKVVFGVVAGFITALFWAALLVALAVGAVWALRHV